MGWRKFTRDTMRIRVSVSWRHEAASQLFRAEKVKILFPVCSNTSAWEYLTHAQALLRSSFISVIMGVIPGFTFLCNSCLCQ